MLSKPCVYSIKYIYKNIEKYKTQLFYNYYLLSVPN